MNAGSIDIGNTGNTPPIFAQAAGNPIVYIGSGGVRPQGEAILVPKDSAIHSLRELKGKKVALNKGSNVHYFLVKALEKEGLRYTDIVPVYLPPADARAAFTAKKVEAWVIWDPYYASAEADLGARVLKNAEGYTSNRDFVLAAKPYAEKHENEIKVVLEELKRTADWFNSHPDEAAKLLAEQIGMDLKPVDKAVRREKYDIELINRSIVGEQQQIADTFYRIGLIPKKIEVQDTIWAPNHEKRG
jgi:sulfonate transport system substrate-binding protein